MLCAASIGAALEEHNHASSKAGRLHATAQALVAQRIFGYHEVSTGIGSHALSPTALKCRT